MPTLDEWEQALAAPRLVRVESSPALLQEVYKRHAKKDLARQKAGAVVPARKANLSVVSQFEPSLNVQVVPLNLLHRLGVVTTPPVENLADICSTWAYFRYLWAFEIPDPGTTGYPLRLSEAARNIDFHQKGLLSDQIGVGMAALLLGAYLNAPLAVDVSVAMNDPIWPIELESDSSPDYLFFDTTQANLFVVECKGTQTSRSTSLDQLRRGTEQVPALSFKDGRVPQSVVVATWLAKDGTHVFLVDPPPDDESSRDRYSGSERTGSREWTVRDEAVFHRTTRLLSDAKLLSFAGADEAAAEKLDRVGTTVSRGPRSSPRQMQVLENEFGEFSGVRQRIALRDRFVLDVFQGLQTSVLKAILSDEPARAEQERRDFQARSVGSALVGIEGSHPVRTSRKRGSVEVISAAPDGSLLEVRVSPI